MKKIIAIMLIMAMLICGCGKAENNTTEPTNATSAPTEGTEGTEPTFEPTGESTEAPTEPTEPSSEEPTDTDPEPDPYAEIKYYPFPLLDMTVAEIEATYGELEYKSYDMHEYTIEYYLPMLNLYLQFDRMDFRVGDAYSGEYDEETLHDHVIPVGIYVIEGTVYPGLTIGTPANEIECVELVTHNGYSFVARNDQGTAFQIGTDEDNEKYHCGVGFKLPDEYADVTPNLVNPESDEGKWVTELFEAFQNNNSSLPLDYVYFVKTSVNML